MATDSGVRQALSAGTRRVFFALWPDPRVRAGLADAARTLHGIMHGRRVREDGIHLTLAFIGAVDERNLARLLAPPDEVFSPGFLLTLDAWGCWQRSGIGWAAPSQRSQALSDLAANLEGWLRGAGFELERRVFRPHVTLLRQAQCVPLPGPMAAIQWQVEAFALINSRTSQAGATYEILRSWPLR
jgi:2'-5' RNA ligase